MASIGWPAVGLTWAGGLVAALYLHFAGRTPTGRLELGLVLALSVAVIGAGVGLLGSRLRPATWGALGVAGLLAVAAFSGPLPAWLAAVAVPILAGGPGLLLARLLLPRPAPIVLVLALGLAALSLAGLAALVGGGVPPVALVAGCAVVWAVALARRAFRMPTMAPVASPMPMAGAERALLGVLWALTAVLVLEASVPDCCGDAVWYHLPLAEAIAEGRYVVMPDLWWTRIPLAYHVLAAVAYALGGGTAAALLHAVFLALAAAWAGWLGTRLAGRLAGLAAVVLFLTIPLVMWEGTVGNADLAAAFFGVAGVGAALEFLRDRRPGWLVTAGLLIGTAAGVKSFAAALLLPIAWLLIRERRRGVGPALWRSGGLLAIGVLATAGPWLVRTAALTGNPVFPAFTENPGAEGLPAGSAIRTYPWTLGRLLALPYLLSFNASTLAEVPPGAMGTFPLLWLPLLAGRWRQLGQSEKDLLLVAGAYAVAVGVFEPSPRFLLPAWLLMVVAAGSAVTSGGPAALPGVPARALGGLVLLAALGHSMIAWLSFMPAAASLDYLVGRLDRRAYLQRTVAGFDVFDDVRRLVPPGVKVLAAGTYATWHVGRPILPAFLPAVRPLFAEPGLSREAALGLLRERGIRYFLAPSSSRYRLLDLRLATPLASEGGFTLYAIAVDP